MNPFEGTTNATEFKPVLPGHTVTALAQATPSVRRPSKAQSVQDDDVDVLIGLFNPHSFGAALREEDFDNSEIVKTLIQTIRTGQDKDKLPAIRMLRDMAKETLTISGHLAQTTAKATQTTPEGETKEVTISQSTLATKLAQRPTITTTAEHPIGVNVTPPLDKKDIDDANIRIPIDRSKLDARDSARNESAQSLEEGDEESDEEDTQEDDLLGSDRGGDSTS